MTTLASALEGARFVAIDGWLGCGKTRAASELAPLLGASAVDLDCFLNRDAGFMHGLRFEQLAAAVEASPRPIVLSGVCIWDVLDRLGLSADIVVYVKRMGGHLWRDEGEILGGDLEVYELGGCPAEPLYYEVRDYHLAREPHENAHFLFLRQG